MKAIVEFGRPQSALPPKAPCGVSAQHICANPTEAARLASSLVHVLSARAEHCDHVAFFVNRARPRVTWWSNARDAWVTVSLLDGVGRGSYAARADKEAKDVLTRDWPSPDNKDGWHPTED